MGLLFSLIIIEAILQILSLSAYLIQRDFFYDNDADYRILALGESTTGELFNGQSTWPAELEKILNNNTKGIKFRVYNEGIPGTNSLVILMHLDDNLRRYNPDFVVSMIGANDGHVSDLRIKKEVFPFSLKIFSLAKWMLERKNYLSSSEKKICETKKNPELENDLRNIYYLIQEWDIEKALKSLDLIEKEDNCNYYAIVSSRYMELFYSVKDDENKTRFLNKSIFWLEKELEYRDNFDSIRELAKSYSLLPDVCVLSNKTEYYKKAEMLYEEYIKKIKNEDCSFEVFPQLLIIYERLNRTQQEINQHFKEMGIDSIIEYIPNKDEKTKMNYNLIYTKLKDKRIKLFAMQYPFLPVKELKDYFGESEYIIFISNEENFLQASKEHIFEELFVDRFSGKFGHETLLGNNIIAKNAANSIWNELNRSEI